MERLRRCLDSLRAAFSAERVGGLEVNYSAQGFGVLVLGLPLSQQVGLKAALGNVRRQGNLPFVALRGSDVLQQATKPISGGCLVREDLNDYPFPKAD